MFGWATNNNNNCLTTNSGKQLSCLIISVLCITLHTNLCSSTVSWAWLITSHHCVSCVFFSCANFDLWGRHWLTTLLRHSYTRLSAADSITQTVCCIASVVGCWGSCRWCKTPPRVLWHGQESSTTSRQCWTNSTGCPWYSVCCSSWRWLFSSASMAWHRPTSPTTASLCRPWLVDVHCGQPTPAIGARNFAVAGPRVWNSLPPELRMLNCAVCTFAEKLKTFLFSAVSASENFWSRAI